MMIQMMPLKTQNSFYNLFLKLVNPILARLCQIISREPNVKISNDEAKYPFRNNLYIKQMTL